MRGKENTYETVEINGDLAMLGRGGTPDFQMAFPRQSILSIGVDWLEGAGCIQITTICGGTVYVPYPVGDMGEACANDFTDLLGWLEGKS